MTILVVGATGFLGSRLVERLANEGRDIIAVCRRPDASVLIAKSNVRWVCCDLVRDEIKATDFPSIDTIVHLAGGWAGGAKAGQHPNENMLLVSNEQITVKLLQTFADTVDKFIIASCRNLYNFHKVSSKKNLKLINHSLI